MQEKEPRTHHFFPLHIDFWAHKHCLLEIRRPLPSLGLGRAAPGITAGVQHEVSLPMPKTAAASGTVVSCLAFPGHISSHMIFHWRFETAGWHVCSFTGNLSMLQISTAPLAFRNCWMVPSHAQVLRCSARPLWLLPSSSPCLSLKLLQLPDFAFFLATSLLPPLVLDATPALTISSLRRVNCVFPLWFYKTLPASTPCQAARSSRICSCQVPGHSFRESS